ncbi:ethylene receptor 3-like [Typha angustifolia]|uniref:ethylene receptor 3-like n=1 Tax=Typha angustifolia TaxID=59011 RepID=UPI003C2B0BB1
MVNALCHGLFILSLLFFFCAAEIEFPHCNCDGEGFWSVDSIFRWQKAGDFLIAAAYFSIPLELLYFVTCANLFPFKWVLFQFGAFIVLCGLTHLLNVFTYEPHSFLLMLSLTISKFLTALVSFLTAITLLTLIPRLLRVKVRENLLRLKARELDREVGLMKRQEEARWHVRMLTQEIRRSLDRHTILYTTLVELSKTLDLQNCAVWMPNEGRREMDLTHELVPRCSRGEYGLSIPIDDPDVRDIRNTEGVRILLSESLLGSASRGEKDHSGPVAAIRMPMLRVSDFHGGTPQVIQTCYAILVLVLPRDDSRTWSPHELEIVEVVADQVAVALSHAAVLEESQLMRDKLVEQNRVLLQAKQNMMMANNVRNAFQRVMSHGMRRPIYSIQGILSMMQEECLTPEQKLIVNTMVRTGNVVSTLINDVMEISTVKREQFAVEMRPFRLQSLIREAAAVARCLCDFRGVDFRIEVKNKIPDRVIGDERWIFHVILHMVGNLLHGCDKGYIIFQVRTDMEPEEWQGRRWIPWKKTFSSGYAHVRFEVEIKRPEHFDSISSVKLARRPNSEAFSMGLRFSMCKNLVQLMQGNIWAVPDSQGLPVSMTLVLQFQPQPPTAISNPGGSFEHQHISSSILKGLKVLLADDDEIISSVTQKLLEKLGCCVSAVSSGSQCLSSLDASVMHFELVILDLDTAKTNGFEVAMRIGMSRDGRWPLVIALTACAKEDMWEKCIQCGINGLIRKPIMLQAMKDELIRLLH